MNEVVALEVAGLGLLGVILTGIVTIITAGMQLLMKLRTTSKHIEVTRQQVTNGHDSNLRDDIDMLAAQLDHMSTASREEHAAIWAAINTIIPKEASP